MDIQKAVNSLIQAEKTKVPIEPFTSTMEDISVDVAYQIQLGYVRSRQENGAKIVGKKIGLTSKAMQEMLKVNQPDYGHIMDDMIFENNSTVSLNQFIAPRIEFEIAFVLKKDLKGPGVTVEEVVAATDYVLPAFEIIDSRIRDWEINFEDTVADNGSSAGAIFGETQKSLENIDLQKVKMDVYQNGQLIDQATGEAVMGNPINAVAWLANAIGSYDITLKKGERILAGALSKAIPVDVGDEFTVHFTELGEISVKFSE